jgi:hypothetical protein
MAFVPVNWTDDTSDVGNVYGVQNGNGAYVLVYPANDSVRVAKTVVDAPALMAKSVTTWFVSTSLATSRTVLALPSANRTSCDPPAGSMPLPPTRLTAQRTVGPTVTITQPLASSSALVERLGNETCASLGWSGNRYIWSYDTRSEYRTATRSYIANAHLKSVGRWRLDTQMGTWTV